jgi:hypothetical protein
MAIKPSANRPATIGGRFTSKPPPPYDRDTEFAATLAKVSAVYDKAAREVDRNQLTQAHETLEAARDLMADLRRRNGVVVFSDPMNAYHAEMERLLIDGPKILAGPQPLPMLMAQVGVREYLARQLRVQAPAQLSQDQEFNRLLKDLEASVQGVKSALVNQDLAAVKQAMSKVKAPYSQLFLQFG